MWIIPHFLSCIIFIGTEASTSENHGIKTLQFSPGGVDFYERYLRENQGLIIKNLALNWPATKHWSNKSYLLDKFSNSDAEIHHDNKPMADFIKKDKEVNISITTSSTLSRDVYLPFFLQCEEFLKNITGVDLILNHNPAKNFKISLEELVIVPISSSISVYLFEENNASIMEDLKDLEVSDIDSEKYDFGVPYHKAKINIGDILYIPKYSWYYLRPEKSNQPFDYISYRFDVFQFASEKTSYFKNLEMYKETVTNSAPTISCRNNKISIHDVLKIDLENLEEKYMHLRIPKKNERPEDVVLASGYKMPVLGLGTALLNESTYDAVKYALTVGYRLFDLAFAYPFCEVSFAKAFSESSVPREEVFIVTKLHVKYLGYNETRRAIDKSLENLKTSYIDLYLIHSTECDDFLLQCQPGEPNGTWKESWRAMEQAVQEGKIRSLGICNVYGEMIFELLEWSTEPVSVIQNWFDPFSQDIETRDICAKYNIRFMGYSTLGTRWTMMGLDYNPIMQSDLITSIAAHYDYVVSHVILRWAIHVNVTVIPRSSNPKHIAQNFRSLEISMYRSDIEEMNRMEQIMRYIMETEQDDQEEQDGQIEQRGQEEQSIKSEN